MKGKLLCFFLFFTYCCSAQNTVFARCAPSDPNIINIKWYTPSIISKLGYHVYRREEAGEWKKISEKPIQFKDYKIPARALQEDKDLRPYMEMLSKSENLRGLVLLAGVVKSFKSEEFSRYLGIWLDDKSANTGVNYQYRVTELTENAELEIGLSEKCKTGLYTAIAAPAELSFKIKKQKVSFHWKPETQRYFGVNIFRRLGDSGVFQRITNDPILLSKIKDKNGVESFGEDFYVDAPPAGNMYYYSFQALDFFGSPSRMSEPMKVYVKDVVAPAAPDSVWFKVKGKTVEINWKKKVKESDLVGYNIYRTNKSDTDFVKVNDLPLNVNALSFIDTVRKFSSFMYRMSAIDNDSNETFTNPHHAEVYDNEPPVKPSGLMIGTDTGKLTLRWQSNKEEDLRGYLLYRSTNLSTEDNYVKMTASAITDTFFIDRLPKNIKNKFLYKVVAVDSSLNRSVYSDFISGRMADVVAPEAPFMETISMNRSKNVVIEWFPNADLDLAGYHIFRKNLADTAGEFERININLLTGVSRFTDRNAPYGICEYYLIALDSSGNSSSASNKIKFKIKKEENSNERLIADFTASYNRKKQQVELKWKINNEENLKACFVYKVNSEEESFSPLATNVEKTKLFDHNVIKNLKYTYQLRAYDLEGDIYRSENITVTIK